MVFSGSPAMQRSDLLAVVSVLDLDSVLERASSIGADRTGARQLVLAVVEQASEDEARAANRPQRLLCRGISEDEATALRARMGTVGLPVEDEDSGVSVHLDVARLRDPLTGTEVLRVPVVVEGRLFADLLLADPQRQGFADEDVASISVLGRVTGVAVRNAVSYTLSERRREAVELGAAVDQSVRPPFLLSEPMSRIAEGAQRISGARTAAVVAAMSHGVDVSAASGEVGQDFTRVLDRVSDLIRTAQVDGLDFTTRVDGRTVWGLPLTSDHAAEGVVVLVMDEARASLTTEDRALLTSFVRHGSLVLDHGVLQRERQHAVLAADRDRIARDLHDVVIQRLYASALRLRASRGSVEETEALVAQTIDELGKSIRDIRGTVFELERGRPASLRSEVLALARHYEPALGFVPVVRSWGPVDSLVGEGLAAQVTVVMREVLSNCARHAGAGRCEVDVAVESGWFSLQVTDDGRGIDADDTPRSGLRNLDARARALGGELVVENAEPRGTRLRWRVPLGPQVGGVPVGPPSASTVVTAGSPAAGVAPRD